jgi:hypothetical protein
VVSARAIFVGRKWTKTYAEAGAAALDNEANRKTQNKNQYRLEPSPQPPSSSFCGRANFLEAKTLVSAGAAALGSKTTRKAQKTKQTRT